MPRHFLLAFLVGVLPVASAQESDQEIHQELRAILTTVQSSINSGDFDAMLPVVSEDIRATTINQEVLSSRKDVSDYFKRWFGPGGYLKKLEMSLDADALSELNPEKTSAVSRGSGVERYTLADGRSYDLKTRWTATMAKESDGQWRLRTIHIGTDFLDNPILAEAKAAVLKYSLGAAAGGLVVGALLGSLLRRRKQ